MEVVFLTYSGSQSVFDSYMPDSGVAQLAGVAKALGVDISFFDLNHLGAKEDFLFYIAQSSPEVIGIKVWDSGLQDILALLPLIHGYSPESKVLLGGPHVTLFREHLFSLSPLVEYLIAGEGEKALEKFLKFVCGEIKIEDVPNLYYRHKDEIVRNEDYIESDLDKLPLPNYQIFPLHKYFPMFQLNFRRGCPHKCTFCSHNYVWGLREDAVNNSYQPVVRHKSFERMSAETLQAIRMFGVDCFSLSDSLPDTQMIMKWAVFLIQQKLTCRWTAFAKIGQYILDQLMILRDSGCTSLWVGVESGDDDMLARMEKPHKVKDVETFFADLKSSGIIGIAGFIAGFPGETIETLQKTIKLSARLNEIHTVMSPFILDPGTAVASIPREFGIELFPDSWSRIINRGETEEFDIHYYNINGKKNTQVWRQLSDLSGYGGRQVDRDVKYEFALVLSERLGTSPEEFIRIAHKAWEDPTQFMMMKLIENVWERRL